MFSSVLDKLRLKLAQLRNAETIARRRRLKRPVAQTRFVVLDTETTGFRAYAGDEIVSIAMLELSGLEATGRVYSQLVNPGRKIPPTSTAIHGISDADVQHAPPINEVIGEVLEFVGDDVVVGHHIAFDVRFLNRALKPMTGGQLQAPLLDTMLMYLSLSGRLGHYSLDEVAVACDVQIKNRHSAMGDAEATSRIFCRLARRLVGENTPVSRLIALQRDAGI